ncbi:MAG TPA: 6-pyruvoyl-tetrahydropterin synthase-related protein [Acidimicrobiales bacterium]
MRRPSAAALGAFVAVGGAVAFVLWQLHPSLLLLNTTTSGGDTGAHVAVPAFLRDHLLPHGRLTGWSPDWYGGYPALTFYFPLPSVIVVAFNLVLPYNIAFKLVTVLGLLTLPVAAWAFGRLSGMARPGPACLAVATLPFLFDRSFTIYGGNVASTLAGEFAFSISLSLGLVFLGVVARGLRTGRHRALAAGLLALTALCHMIPTFFVLVGAGVLLLMGADRRRLKWIVTAVAAGLAITGFWSIPFLFRLPYTTDMGWEKVTNYAHNLFPSGQRWVLVLAIVGVAFSLLRRRRIGIFLTVMAVLSAAGFVLAPQGRLYNARLLPFWVLCLYLLAGVAVAELGTLAGELWRTRRGQRWLSTAANGGYVAAPASGTGMATDAVVGFLTPVLALVAAAGFVAAPLVNLPSWSPVKPTASFVPDWVKWNYTGYEGKPAYPQYHAVVDTMARLGRQQGCGRAMWEYGPDLDQLGTPMALMLLPYWTNDCIQSMEGLFFESAASTPYHFINQAELSLTPSEAMRNLPYESLDVAAGVRHMQLLGVRYYMAFSPQAQAQAATDPDLSLIATSGPWPVTSGGTVIQRTWNIYAVRGAAEVAPLTEQPVVMTGVAKGGKSWLNAAVSWYDDPSRWNVMLAASGPAQWTRVRGADPNPPQQAVTPAQVSGIKTTDDRISFDVDRPGSPVLVKASYFPNWQATGAKGPWRVAPNLMVVIPTSRHVSLHYGWTPVDGLGWAVTALGLIAVVWMGARPYVGRGPRRGRRIGRPDDTRGHGTQDDEEARELETALNRIGALSPLPWAPSTSPTTGATTSTTTQDRPPGT